MEHVVCIIGSTWSSAEGYTLVLMLCCLAAHTTQPWRAFKPDGVIFFSDILTPLPALGIEFDVVKGKGPVIATPLRHMDQVRMKPCP